MLPPDETLKRLGLHPGEIMADVGCGIGYFTLEAARIVEPTGKVYALDISSEMLSDVQNKAAAANLSNITTVKTAENTFPLDSGAVTFCFAAFVLHEVDDVEKFLNEFKRIMNANGKAVFIEWEKKETKMGPPVNHRLAKQALEKLLEKQGFIDIHLAIEADAYYAITAKI
jgi:ubiquinone/menaquinone biosynthesis C-methylase UbiE